MFNEIRSRYFGTYEVWWSSPESVCLYRAHGRIPCNVTKNASFVLTCYYNNTNLKNSRQRHGKKEIWWAWSIPFF